MTSFSNINFSQLSWSFPIVVIVTAVLANIIIYWVANAFRKKAQPHKRVWQNAFLRALDAPLRALVWVIGLSVLTAWFAQKEEWLGLQESIRSEEHTSELQSRPHLVCRLLLEKKKKKKNK